MWNPSNPCMHGQRTLNDNDDDDDDEQLNSAYRILANIPRIQVLPAHEYSPRVFT